MSRAVNKSSPLYTNGSWDLVDAEKSNAFKYDDLSDSDHPAELRASQHLN